MKTETLDEMIKRLADTALDRIMNSSHEDDAEYIRYALRSLAEKLLNRQPSEAVMAAGLAACESTDLKTVFLAMRAVEREELGMK